MPDAASRDRLATLGIDVWVRRRTTSAGPARDMTTGPVAESESDESLRIRMASGSGDWLLVQREPWSGAHEALLADIRATLGDERCRFGQWAVSDSAGLPVTEVASQGVAHLLSFGPPPRATAAAVVHQAPTLDELAGDASARRALWQLLAPLVAD